MGRLVNHFKRYRFVLSELVKKGITLRYRRSYLGMLWTLLEPLLNMIVLYYVFGSLLGRTNAGYGGLHFMVYILVGRLVFTCFNQSTKECTKAMRLNAALIKKVHIPKYLFPLSYIFIDYILFLISLIVLGAVSAVLIITGGQPMVTVGVFQMIIPMINLFLLNIGAGLILATIGVFFRDMEYLWGVFMNLIFYACAIFYSMDAIYANAPTVAKIMSLNPLYCIITNFRECLQPAGVINWFYVAYSFCFSVVAIIIGVIVFRKNQDKFILYV